MTYKLTRHVVKENGVLQLANWYKNMREFDRDIVAIDMEDKVRPFNGHTNYNGSIEFDSEKEYTLFLLRWS